MIRTMCQRHLTIRHRRECNMTKRKLRPLRNKQGLGCSRNGYLLTHSSLLGDICHDQTLWIYPKAVNMLLNRLNEMQFASCFWWQDTLQFTKSPAHARYKPIISYAQFCSSECLLKFSWTDLWRPEPLVTITFDQLGRSFWEVMKNFEKSFDEFQKYTTTYTSTSERFINPNMC